ncbi:MAG: ABC transporter permease subunit [Saprospiraceae bacterium]|nr:ABC transporter permease subunit [Saprospiraceae bacterium]
MNLIFTKQYFPGIMPAISSAIRVAAATGFGLTVAAEYLGAQGGLGFYIRNARVTLNTEAILLAALILGILSLLTDQLIRMAFRFINKWNNN